MVDLCVLFRVYQLCIRAFLALTKAELFWLAIMINSVLWQYLHSCLQCKIRIQPNNIVGIPCYSMIQQHIMHQKGRILKEGHQFSRIRLLTFLLLRFLQHRLHNLVLHHLRQKIHLCLSQLLRKRQNSQMLHEKCHKERKSHPPRSQHKIAFHMLCGKTSRLR